MKLKSFILAAIALTGFAGNANADTSKLLEADGWTKITTLPTATDIANNYYVFVDNSNDLMLGVAKGVNQNTKWYSLGVYYQTSVEPTSADMNGKTWILETQGDGFAMRNLEYSVSPFQTEWNAAWKFDTNDVYETPNGWCKISMLFSDNSWTIQNGYYPSSGYLGPWTDGNFTDGAECAANKTGNNVGHFQIYAISRTQFKQNLLDNASTSNPVDLTPWYVTNATFDANNRTGWTEEGSGGNNNTTIGCEIWHRSNFKIYQDLTVPNGKYKVSLQIAGTTGAGQVYGISGSTTKTVVSSATAGDNFQNTVLSMIQDRTFGKVLTDEIEVTNGALQMGMKCETTDQWIVFDNFKLYCTGVDLSAYQTQLSDLVTVCNTFISSDVVPDACEAAISNAITQYNQTYSTAKEYSNAIVALTSVLNTYRSDTELQDAYANYYAFKAKVMGLTTGQESSEALTTFNTAISTATSAVEAATTAEAITEQIPNLRSAGLTYISSVDGQFDITFLASQVYSDWKKKDGSAAGIVQDQFLANRPSTIPSFAESFEWTAATTGNVLYQTVSGLPAGYYQVGMYTMALSTSQRDNIATEATEGDADRSFAFAGDLTDATSIQRTGMPIKFATAVDFDDLTTLDVNVHLSSDGDLTFGVQKDANGSNWHFAQIMSIVYSNAPDLTQLKATRDALVAEATGLKNGADAVYLTSAQKTALQDAIDAGNAANTFDDLNTVTLTTLPNAINTAKQQIAQAKAAVPVMLAALERFENDYNLADGTDYSRMTMSAGAWTDLLTAVNNVSTALDDISQASTYATIAQNLIAQMDATDASLRLFKSYKAMVDGTQALSITEGTTYAADGNMDTDATENTAIAALNTAFVTYAANQSDDFPVNAFLGENLDFSAEHGQMIVGTGNGIGGGGNYGIFDIAGWEEYYKDYSSNYYIQTANTSYQGQLYIRSNWESTKPTLQVRKERMLPVGRYRLTLDWNSNMANMNNMSAFVVGSNSTDIGEITSEAKSLSFEFIVSESAQPFDIVFGFKRTSTGDAAAQILVDNVTLTYLQTALSLADADDNTETITAATAENHTFDVTLSGRTLYKDGAWNTLCLPFDMTEEQVTNQLAPTALMELDLEDYKDYEHVTGLEGATLYLNFKTANSINAGTPYIIKWASGDAIENPTFTNVTITGADASSVGNSDVSFLGTYAPVSLAKDDKSSLYLGADDKLYWPSVDDFTVNAFRAYFKLGGSTEVRQFVLNFGDEASGISATLNEKGEMSNDKVYDLQGRQLSNSKWSNSQIKKGLYISNGKKIIIK